MQLNDYFNLITGDCGEKFSAFYKLILKQNEICNLTAVTEEGDVYIKHFLDSVAGESFFKSKANVLEVGSGAGFPSLPLKIVREDLNFTLIESTGKKCNFLNLAVKELELKGVKVLNIRAEDGAKEKSLREKFDVVCARAVARLNTLCEYCLPFVKVGGLFIAYKGSDGENEVKEAENAIKVLGGKIKSVEKYSLLQEKGERSLIIIEKVSATDKKYPRGNGKERKNPL